MHGRIYMYKRVGDGNIHSSETKVVVQLETDWEVSKRHMTVISNS